GNIERLPEDVVHVPAESDVPRIFGDILIDVAVAVHLDQIEFGFRSRILPFVFDRLAKFRDESCQRLVAGEAEVLIAEQVTDRGDRLDVVADVARTNARLIVAKHAEIALACCRRKRFQVLSAREPVEHTREFIANCWVRRFRILSESRLDKRAHMVERTDAEGLLGGAHNSLGAPPFRLSTLVRALYARQSFMANEIDGCRIVL